MAKHNSEFSRVYEEQVFHVFAFFSYRVRDRNLAEDLTQGTFERALRAWPRFDPRKASERTWLLAIARNLLIDHHRRQHADLVAEFDDQKLPSVAGPELAFSGSGELEEALGQLAEREREILALRFGAEMTGPEIAELLGLSLANVQQIMSRALRRLRAILEAAD